MFNSYFKLRVAEVLSSSQLVLNAGKQHGIEKGDEFIIYGLSDNEIIDPNNNRSLGKLELFRGIGKVIYLQDTMSIIQAFPSTPILRASLALGTTNTATFNNACIGDYAKPNATPVSEKPQD